jgi:hypothetical protein
MRSWEAAALCSVDKVNWAPPRPMCGALPRTNSGLACRSQRDLGKLVLIAGDGVKVDPGVSGHGTLLSGRKAKYARAFPA